jgi:hypothetical protein
MTGNGGATYVYDAKNRLIATGGFSYIYDGDGERVEKCTEGTTPGTCASGATGTLYWRGLGSDPLSETDLSGNVLNTYIFFGGQRVARRGLAQPTYFLAAIANGMPHPWRFHGWAAANSPCWHVHRSQLNRRVPVTSFPCRQTCTATTVLDTPTLLPQVAISAVRFSAPLALAISSSKCWSRFASAINL